MRDLLGQAFDVRKTHCPSRRLLDLIANKWSVLIVYVLADGTKRHGQVRREIGGISQKMLTQTLRALEQEGIVTRTVHPVVPPAVEYALTPRGEALIEPLRALIRWAESVDVETAGSPPAPGDPAPGARPGDGSTERTF